MERGTKCGEICSEHTAIIDALVAQSGPRSYRQTLKTRNACPRVSTARSAEARSPRNIRVQQSLTVINSVFGASTSQFHDVDVYNWDDED